jgi:Fe2+ transport system protein FeoA
MSPLSRLEKGQSAIILGYDLESGPEPTLQRLVELGFMLNETVRIVERAWSGSPIIVELLGSSYALGQEEASRIMVKVVSHET